MRRTVISLQGLVKAGAAATALFSAATALDDLHQYLELFSHFKLQYLAVAVLFSLYFVVVRDRRYLALMVAVTLLNAWYVVPWHVPQSDTIQGGESFKILLANVLRNNGEHGELTTLLAAEQPDVVFLQEVSDSWARHLDQLPEYPHRHVIPDNGHFGIAVLSKVPLIGTEIFDSPPFDFPTIVTSARIDGEVITFTTTHPSPPIGRAGYDGRNEQLADIAERVSRQSGARVLIGDLNTSMWGANYRNLIARTGLRNARKGFGILPTWPTHIPIAYIPIDHCLVSDELEVLDIHTGPDIGSDHLPLVVTLR